MVEAMTPKRMALQAWSGRTRAKNRSGWVATSFQVSRKPATNPSRARSAKGEGTSGPEGGGGGGGPHPPPGGVQPGGGGPQPPPGGTPGAPGDPTGGGATAR